MKNFIDPMQLSCQNILKRLESQEVRYLMHQKKWLKNFILVFSNQHIYEIWNNSEHLQQGLILSFSDQLALDKTEQILEIVSEVSSISLLATEISKKNG